MEIAREISSRSLIFRIQNIILRPRRMGMIAAERTTAKALDLRYIMPLAAKCSG